MNATESVPTLVVVIGANGSGKTTWAGANRTLLPKPFYNADSIAEGLGDANDDAMQREARKIVDDAIERDFLERRSFGFESTYSGRSRPAIVRRARELGYDLQAVFIGTREHEINIERVRRRVSEGGHHIPEQEIVRRWTDAQTNLLQTWACFNSIRILDNSEDAPVTVLQEDRGTRKVTTAPPVWVQDLISRQTRTAGEPER